MPCSKAAPVHSPSLWQSPAVAMRMRVAAQTSLWRSPTVSRGTYGALHRGSVNWSKMLIIFPQTTQIMLKSTLIRQNCQHSPVVIMVTIVLRSSLEDYFMNLWLMVSNKHYKEETAEEPVSQKFCELLVFWNLHPFFREHGPDISQDPWLCILVV